MALRCYISGRMSNRLVDDVKSERARATKELAKYKIYSVDPAASESRLWADHKKAKISSRFTREVMAAMVARDLYLIRRSDCLLYLTADDVSEGSLLEVRYAQTIGIPVVIVSPNRYSENWMGWLNIMIPKQNIFPDMKSAIRYIHIKYQKEYERNKKYYDAAIKQASYDVSHTRKRRKKKIS